MTTASSSTVRYRVVAWLIIAASVAYLCRNAVGVVESTIRDELGLSLEQSGWFMGAFFWAYAVFQVPCARLSERWGTRVALTVFVIAWSIATLGIALATGFWQLVVAQLMMGVAQAGIFPASCNSIGHWIPLAQRALACATLAAGMQTGAIAASSLTGILANSLGWRWVFAVFAFPGALWSLWFYSRFRDRPEMVSEVSQTELALIRSDRAKEESRLPEPASARAELLSMMCRPVMWWLCGQQICRSAGYMFFASWFPTFLQETRGVSVENSGYLQTVLLTGTLIGSVAGGMLTDWVWRKSGSLRLSRSGVGAAVLAACALLVLSAWFVHGIALAVTLLAFGCFFAAIAGPAAFAAAIDLGGERVPQAFGLMNMCGNFAAAACPVLVGSLFAWTADWNLVLLCFACNYLIGALCWLFVNPDQSIVESAANNSVCSFEVSPLSGAAVSE